jgi:hypothetical protein
MERATNTAFQVGFYFIQSFIICSELKDCFIFNQWNTILNFINSEKLEYSTAEKFHAVSWNLSIIITIKNVLLQCWINNVRFNEKVKRILQKNSCIFHEFVLFLTVSFCFINIILLISLDCVRFLIWPFFSFRFSWVKLIKVEDQTSE